MRKKYTRHCQEGKSPTKQSGNSAELTGLPHPHAGLICDFRIRNDGFTLAEVLITLGVIGVVAALTMPALIANYQKKQTIVKLKKFYNMLSQALYQAQAENGDFSTWTYSNSSELFDDYLAKYFKIVKREDNIHVHGDFTGGIKYIFADGTSASCSLGNNFNESVAECLFYTYSKPYNNDAGNSRFKPRREMFYFLIDNRGIVVAPHMYRTRAQNLASCSTQWGSGNNGYVDCLTVIWKDGWEIKDDYPW